MTCFVFWKDLISAGVLNFSTADIWTEQVFVKGSGEVALCSVGILEASLASAWHLPSCENQTVSRHGQMSSRCKRQCWLRTTALVAVEVYLGWRWEEGSNN